MKIKKFVKDHSGAVTPSEYASEVQLKRDNQVHLYPYQVKLHVKKKLTDEMEK